MQGHHTHHQHSADPAGTVGHDSHRRANDAGHGHSHGPMNYDRAFAVGIALNVTYALTEATAGFWLNSLALVADAGHNLSDVLGLVLAWFAVWLSRRKPSARHSYGLGRSSILAALANALLLLLALVVIVWEASTRFSHPETIATGPVVWIATIGIAVNAFTAWLFMRGSKTDLNVRGAYLHMLADAAVSAGVVISALVMSVTGWMWLDPLTSLAIAAVIAWGSWQLLVDSVRLSLDAVPAHVNATAIGSFLESDPLVADLHDLHIWALSTEAVALTAHVVCPAGHPGDAWLSRVCEELHDRHGIDHATIQVETGHSLHHGHGHQHATL
jgi:cobalt-zinc-cadmium efflux system protein